MTNKMLPNVSGAYLADQLNSKKEDRPSVLVCGDIEFCIYKEAEAKYLNIRIPTVGMAMRDPKSFEELGGEKMEAELIAFIDSVYLPGVPFEKVPHAYFRHSPTREGKSKPEYELNIFVVQMLDGKKFYFYMDKDDLALRQAADNYWHKLHPEFTIPDSRPQYFSYKSTWSKKGGYGYER